MPGVRLSTLVRRLRRNNSAEAGCSDADLLARFARGRDEAAFELLVWRHGAMVLSACRRILRHAEDAEDAFQAVFLVLARKAGGVSRGAALPSWLHRVAVRLSTRLARSRRATAPLETEPVARAVPSRSEELGILDEEIDRLPERHRRAVVLCYLEGLTAAEAARRLGCPTGTVESRLAAARKKLRDRLTRRGVTLPAGVLALLAGQAVLAPEAVAKTVRAALAFARGGVGAARGIVGEPPVRLAQGALTMWRMKASAALALVTVAVAATAGVSWADRPANLPAEVAAAGAEPPPAPTAPDPVKPGDPADPRARKEWWGEPVSFGKLVGNRLGLSPDGKRALVSAGSALFCADLSAAKIVWRADVKTLHTAEFSPDGKLVATAEWQDGADLYDAATGRLLETYVVISRDGERPDQVGFLPDGRLVVLAQQWTYREPPGLPERVTQTLGYSLIVWDPATRKEVRRTHEVLTYQGSHVWLRLMGRGQVMQRLEAFEEHGRTVKKTVSYTDPLTGKATPALVLDKDDDHLFDLSPDGKTLLLRAAGRAPRLIDTTTGKVKATLDGHRRLVTGGAFSPDGRLIATVSGTNIDGYERAKLLPGGPPDGPAELIIRDAETGKPVAKFEYPTGQYDFTGVVFSPDGKYLIATTLDRRVVAWGQLPFPRPAIDERVGLPTIPGPVAPPRPTSPAGGPPAPGGLVSDALDKLVEELPKSGRPAAQQVDALFLAALGRLPTAAELKKVGEKYGPKPTAESLRAILAELVASPEFEAHVKTLQKRLPGPNPFGGDPEPLRPRFGPPPVEPSPKKP